MKNRLYHILAAVLLLSSSQITTAAEVTVWIGMSRHGTASRKAFTARRLDDESGAISQPVIVVEAKSPGYLALHPDGKVLYAVCQQPDGTPCVAAFKIADDKQSLSQLNSEPIGDGDACHLAVDNTGKCLFTAQYGNSSVAAFPLAEDGRLKPRSALVKHTGTGPDKTRQEKGASSLGRHGCKEPVPVRA